MRRRGERVLMSVRTAPRSFDLPLAIATSPISQSFASRVEDSSSVWRQQGGPFLFFLGNGGRRTTKGGLKGSVLFLW